MKKVCHFNKNKTKVFCAYIRVLSKKEPFLAKKVGFKPKSQFTTKFYYFTSNFYF